MLKLVLLQNNISLNESQITVVTMIHFVFLRELKKRSYQHKKVKVQVCIQAT